MITQAAGASGSPAPDKVRRLRGQSVPEPTVLGANTNASTDSSRERWTKAEDGRGPNDPALW